MKKALTLGLSLAMGIGVIIAPASALAAENDFLAEVYQEEVTARDMYKAYLGVYPNTRVFTNILRAEENHILHVANLMEDLSMEVPEQKATDIQVPETLEEAVTAALDYEKMDIAGLEELLAANEDPQIESVLTALLKGSTNHEAALQRNLDGKTGVGIGRMRNQGMGNSGTGMGNRAAGRMNRNFTDTDKDGVCDSMTAPGSPSGTGMRNGSGSGSMRRGR